MIASIRIRTVALLLSAIIGGLFTLHMIAQYGRRVLGQDQIFGIGRMFHMDAEQNFPTYFNGVLLAAAGTLLWLIWGATRQAKQSGSGYWFLLGCVFWFMSIDDMILLHERLNGFVGKFSAFQDVHNKWVVAGVVIVFAVAAFFFRFWLRLPSKTRFWFGVSAVVFIGGAIGFESISLGYLQSVGHENKDMLYAALTGIEEAMEMAGITIFIVSLMRYIHAEIGICGVQLIADQPASAKQPTRSAHAATV